MGRLWAVKRFVASNGARVYRIPCRVLENLMARVYLVLGAGPPTLIDTGSGQGESTAQILVGLETVRTEFDEPVRPGDIKRILITHGHVDHVGGLWDLLDSIDAELGIHPLDRRALTAREERSVMAMRRTRAFLRQAGVAPERRNRLTDNDRFVRERYRSLRSDISLDDGRVLDGLQFIHTPGHTPGHVCVVVGDLLLAGDHILARTIPQLWPETMIPFCGLAHYLDSLDKVRQTGGFDMALPAHEPTIRDVYRRIDTIRESHVRRLGRVAEVVAEAERPMSVSDIAQKLYTQATGFRGLLALTDVGARVEYLHQRGQLAIVNLDELEREEDAVCRYGPT